MHIRELLIQGALWRVGDGKSISLVRDRWIPSVPHQLSKPIVNLPADLKVNFLIDEVVGRWNEDRACYEEVANLILKIPLSLSSYSDFIAWLHTKIGIFTVK